MALQLIDSFTIDNADSQPALQLCMGDVTNLSTADAVNFLVVSALPGDYSPSSGSVIGALNQAGVSVEQLSQNKAANYEPKIPCWVSGPVTSNNPGIQFQQILLFEPATPAQAAPGLVWSIFQALSCFQGNTSTTVALPMVCTGSSGASFPAIIQALFNAATYAGSLAAMNLPVIKLVAYNSSQLALVQPVFAALKGNYQNLVNLSLPNYQFYALSAWSFVQGIGLPTGLTRRQAFGVSIYTSNYYPMINNILRNPSDPNYQPMMPLFGAIDGGLANIAASPGMTYRGERSMSSERLNQYQVGASILSLAYTSTARPAGSWYNGVPYKFNLNGITCPSIGFLSQFPENEYLYQRNMIAGVTSRSCNTGNTQCTFGMQETPVNYCSSTVEEFFGKTEVEIL
jgi:hypothetical protein